jgi:hypothetical protein
MVKKCLLKTISVKIDIVYKGKHEDAISWMRSDKMMK